MAPSPSPSPLTATIVRLYAPATDTMYLFVRDAFYEAHSRSSGSFRRVPCAPDGSVYVGTLEVVDGWAPDYKTTGDRTVEVTDTHLIVGAQTRSAADRAAEAPVVADRRP